MRHSEWSVHRCVRRQRYVSRYWCCRSGHAYCERWYTRHVPKLVPFDVPKDGGK